MDFEYSNPGVWWREEIAGDDSLGDAFCEYSQFLTQRMRIQETIPT